MKLDNKSILCVLMTCFLAWTGCAESRHRTDDATSKNVLDLLKLSKSVWHVQDIPEYPKTKSPRIVIVEFSVEYATHSSPSKTARVADFATGMKVQLPDVLYRSFVEILPEFNRHPLPLATVNQSVAYHKLKGRGVDHSILLSPVDSSGNDSGRYPVDGLLVLDDSQEGAEQVIVDLLREVEANVALQVRIRVGVRDNRASIEKGSTFRAFVPQGTALLEIERTVISPINVVARDQGTDSKKLAIESGKFVKAIKRLFRTCIAMALIASDRPLE